MTIIYEVHTDTKSAIYVNDDLWVIIAPDGRGNMGSNSFLRAGMALRDDVPMILVCVDDEWWSHQKDWIPSSFDDIVLHKCMTDPDHPNINPIPMTGATRNWRNKENGAE